MVDAKLAAKEDLKHKTLVPISETLVCGGKDLVIIGGPCSVESLEQMEETASLLCLAPVQMLRGGAFKPRTSPYAFQGLGAEGLQILSSVSQLHNLPVVTEVMSPEQVPLVCRHAHMMQIGSRNMQNFELLKAAARGQKPILLKRGLAATIEETIMAAEYILNEGNADVIICERGIRSFDPYTRNVLDLGAVVALKQITHLPVIVDPSHAAGRRELIADLSLAAVAAGADGLIIECHPEPEKSVSDARQALSLDEMVALVERLSPVAEAIGRRVVGHGMKTQLSVISAPTHKHASQQRASRILRR